jgi:uncharacterized protein (TIGR00255 family)
MTGYGSARREDSEGIVQAEVRAVNHRHLKVVTRLSSPSAAVEQELERLLRKAVRRGTVQVNVHVARPAHAEDHRLNLNAIASYRDQLANRFRLGDSDIPWGSLLALPGVVEARKLDELEEADQMRVDWPRIAPVVEEAIGRFQAAREEEGRTMEVELRKQVGEIERELNQVRERVPRIVTEYEGRLRERVQSLVREHGVLVEPRDLVREVALFADRADIAEEITRLRGHLDRFRAILDEPESPGRTLEFQIQEIGREINTLGAKVNDLESSRCTVTMKGALEKMRELIQNIE